MALKSHKGNHYDLLVIGSGPGGQRAAICAGKLGKKVGIIERRRQVGGVCTHTGTIPSKSMRETALAFSQLENRSLCGVESMAQQQLTVPQMLAHTQETIRKDVAVISDQLLRNNIEIIEGVASFHDTHRVSINSLEGITRMVTADFIVVATGSRPLQPRNIPFDETHFFTAETIFSMNDRPESMIIIGGGVIGTEYTCIFAHLGIHVKFIVVRDRFLPWLDIDISTVLQEEMIRAGVEFVFVDKSDTFEADVVNNKVKLTYKSGLEVEADKMLFAAGRLGNTEPLNIAAAGLEVNSRGLVTVNEYYQSNIPHIYAVGDVIGFPALASTSKHQGRMASYHAFGEMKQLENMNPLLPIGIFSIPEISLVGKSGDELEKEGIEFLEGTAVFTENIRGSISGNSTGFLKLVFDPKSLEILGCHIIGVNAAELIHIPQALMTLGGTLDYFSNTVMNCPTISEAFTTACFDGLKKSRLWEAVEQEMNYMQDEFLKS